MFDFIKFCSDTFYVSFDQFCEIFSLVIGAGCFFVLVFVGFLFFISFIYLVCITVKEKYICWKQRKADNDA